MLPELVVSTIVPVNTEAVTGCGNGQCSCRPHAPQRLHRSPPPQRVRLAPLEVFVQVPFNRAHERAARVDRRGWHAGGNWSSGAGIGLYAPGEHVRSSNVSKLGRSEWRVVSSRRVEERPKIGSLMEVPQSYAEISRPQEFEQRTELYNTPGRARTIPQIPSQNEQLRCPTNHNFV